MDCIFCGRYLDRALIKEELFYGYSECRVTTNLHCSHCDKDFTEEEVYKIELKERTVSDIDNFVILSQSGSADFDKRKALALRADNDDELPFQE